MMTYLQFKFVCNWIFSFFSHVMGQWKMVGCSQMIENSASSGLIIRKITGGLRKCVYTHNIVYAYRVYIYIYIYICIHTNDIYIYI